ncbi:tRNA 2-selenouridine(34) synthase MnmH [soil metagenome]
MVTHDLTVQGSDTIPNVRDHKIQKPVNKIYYPFFLSLTFVAHMAIEKITIETLLALSKTYPVLDVRSPGEYKHAHIPGAYSLPLFTDEERKVVGTAYKQQSREQAIKIALPYFGTKMVAMVEVVEQLTGLSQKDIKAGNKKTVIVHCWRGGMRSAGVAWLLDIYGFKVYTLIGGYKVFRKWVLAQFEKSYPFKVIGGYTGSGKTGLLQELKTKGETVIDLEALACHKGSAFGNLGEPAQPSQEMFENKLAIELSTVDSKQPTIWIEDESQRIGNINIPAQLYKCKQSMPVYFIDIPFKERLEHIVHGYGQFDKEHFINAIMRIKKRLGPLETKTAVNFLLEDDLHNCFAVLLKYYDKWYSKSLLQLREATKNNINRIKCPTVDASTNAQHILKTFENIPA